MADEAHLIGRISRAIPSFIGTKGRSQGVPLGIGDDAMLIRAHGNNDWVITTDVFVQDVHFWANKHPADSVGFKALARATSDLAAMGAKPRLFLLTLALPASRTGEWLDGFLRGMGRAARSLGLGLAGGDTTQSDSISIGVTVLGELSRGRAVTRSAARPGDVLFVSGTLGGAQLGLQLIRQGMAANRSLASLLRPHLYPQIRVELGAWLAAHCIASAMMDLSDGLSTDLARMCAASGVAAQVHAERVPCVEIPPKIAALIGKKNADPLQMALHGGDDYELLFTVPKRLVARMRGAPGFESLRAIGEISRGRRLSLIGTDGRAKPLVALGWDSFRDK
jgi:thiamine-monophosphate kinase